MVNELIWDKYQQLLKLQSLDSNPDLYKKVVQQIQKNGFRVRCVPEFEMLANFPYYSLRIYGSKVNSEVPNILGAVSSKTIETESNPFISLTSPSKSPKAISSPEKTYGNPVVAVDFTLAKLRVGNLLLLASADLLRFNLGEDTPLVIINNNTGPRAAKTLLRLANQENASPKEVALAISQGLIGFAKISEAYRTRDLQTKGNLAKALSILDTSKYDIFAPVANRMTVYKQ